MNSITPVNDSNCVHGTLKSILKDSNCPNDIKERIFIKINEITQDNITWISHSNVKDEIEKLTQEFFENFQERSITNLSEFKKTKEIADIDNTNSFGILFWRGNAPNENGNYYKWHTTRFICQNQDKIKLMNPEGGIIQTFDETELLELSPQGLNLVIFSKKILYQISDKEKFDAFGIV